MANLDIQFIEHTRSTMKASTVKITYSISVIHFKLTDIVLVVDVALQSMPNLLFLTEILI